MDARRRGLEVGRGRGATSTSAAFAVERRPDGTLAAAGDPRRGGHGIVVG